MAGQHPQPQQPALALAVRRIEPRPQGHGAEGFEPFGVELLGLEPGGLRLAGDLRELGPNRRGADTGQAHQQAWLWALAGG